MRMLARVTASLSDDRAGDEGNAAGMPTNVGLEADDDATAPELLACKAVRKGDSGSVGASTIPLVDHGTAVMQRGSINGDGKGPRKVRKTREHGAAEKALQRGNGGENGKRARDGQTRTKLTLPYTVKWPNVITKSRQ